MKIKALSDGSFEIKQESVQIPFSWYYQFLRFIVKIVYKIKAGTSRSWHNNITKDLTLHIVSNSQSGSSRESTSNPASNLRLIPHLISRLLRIRFTNWDTGKIPFKISILQGLKKSCQGFNCHYLQLSRQSETNKYGCNTSSADHYVIYGFLAGAEGFQSRAVNINRSYLTICHLNLMQEANTLSIKKDFVVEYICSTTWQFFGAERFTSLNVPDNTANPVVPFPPL